MTTAMRLNGLNEECLRDCDSGSLNSANLSSLCLLLCVLRVLLRVPLLRLRPCHPPSSSSSSSSPSSFAGHLLKLAFIATPTRLGDVEAGHRLLHPRLSARPSSGWHSR